MWSQTVQANEEARHNNYLSSNEEHMQLPMMFTVCLNMCALNAISLFCLLNHSFPFIPETNFHYCFGHVYANSPKPKSSNTCDPGDYGH